MIKIQIIGNLAHNNLLFDSTCKQCGGIFNRSKTANCPKCNNPVVPIAAKNGRAMMVSEGTMYPLATQAQKDADAKSRSKRKNSMEIVYRFVVLSFADATTGIVSEPHIHPYLAKGRQVMVEINHNPLISHFTAGDGSTKCEVRLGILSNGGDTIRLLGKKEAMNNLTLPEKAVAQTESIPGVDDKLLTMKAELEKLINAQTTQKQAVVAAAEPFDGIIIDNEEQIEIF